MPLFIGSVWIGLQKGSNGLEWTDGTPVDYVFWKEGEPNNNDELCVEMYAQHDGEWNDEHCTDQAEYICKMPQNDFNGGAKNQGVRSNQVSSNRRNKCWSHPGCFTGRCPGWSTSGVLSLETYSFDAKAVAYAAAPTGFDNALYVTSTDKAAIVTDA